MPRSNRATCRWQTRSPKTLRCRASGIPRRYIGDRIARTASPHRLLDPEAGPLIGVKLHVLTRKTLGGIQTDLGSRAIGNDGQVIDELYAAGRGGRLRRWRCARIQRAGRDLPGGLPVLRPGRRSRCGGKAVMTKASRAPIQALVVVTFLAMIAANGLTVMSGTSLDGVDVVLAAIDENMVAQQASLTWPIRSR